MLTHKALSLSNKKKLYCGWTGNIAIRINAVDISRLKGDLGVRLGKKKKKKTTKKLLGMGVVGNEKKGGSRYLNRSQCPCLIRRDLNEHGSGVGTQGNWTKPL